MNSTFANGKVVADIMGSNFFGIDDALTHFDPNPHEEDLKVLTSFSFTDNVLKMLEKHKDSYILAAILPFSLVMIKLKHPQLFDTRTNRYNSELFATDRGTTGWWLIGRGVLAGSTSRSWASQLQLVHNDFACVPTIRALAYAVVGHFLKTGERLLAKHFTRTANLSSASRRVDFGGFGSHGLDFCDQFEESYPYRNTGLTIWQKI